MQHPSRRPRRPVRRIASPTTRPTSTPELRSWRTGLAALTRLDRLFPEVAQLLHGDPCTPALLVRAGETLLGLVHQRMPLIIQYQQLPYACYTDPLGYLRRAAAAERTTDAPAEHTQIALATLDALADDLDVLIPEGFGVGLSLWFDDDVGPAPNLLTVALWRLLEGTAWMTGIDWDYMLDDVVYFPDDESALVAHIRPLPSAVDLESLCQTLTIPRWSYTTPPGTLVAYAVERCDNPLANIQNGPGPMEPATLDWSELPDLLPTIDEARQIARDYHTWADAVAADSETELRRIRRALLTAAQSQLNARRVPKTLLEILVPA